MMLDFCKKVIILTGHYGCGKTNLAVNLALRLSEQGSVTIVDMDTVNPYFRTADFSDILKEKGIRTIVPQYADTNLDLPVLNFDLESIFLGSDVTILDLGGSDAGAYPLRRYRNLFSEGGTYADSVSMLYVCSMYRLTDRSAEETVRMLREIENACCIPCTGIVNNSNLGAETTPQLVADSESFAGTAAMLAGIPLVCTCVPETMPEDALHFPVKRLVINPWEIS